VAARAAGQLRPVFIPALEAEALRDLVRAREDLRGEWMSARHRISKLLLRFGHVFDEPDETWSTRHLRWLSGVRFAEAVTETVFGEYHAHHEVLLAPRERLDRLLVERSVQGPWAPTVVGDHPPTGLTPVTTNPFEVGGRRGTGPRFSYEHPAPAGAWLSGPVRVLRSPTARTRRSRRRCWPGGLGALLLIRRRIYRPGQRPLRLVAPVLLADVGLDTQLDLLQVHAEGLQLLLEGFRPGVHTSFGSPEGEALAVVLVAQPRSVVAVHGSSVDDTGRCRIRRQPQRRPETPQSRRQSRSPWQGRSMRNPWEPALSLRSLRCGDRNSTDDAAPARP
jgi:hypothetical protein